MSPATPSPAPAEASSWEEKLARLPAGARDRFLEFRRTGSDEALSALVIDVLNHHRPRAVGGEAPRALTDASRLVEDVGFDSMATIETVFFFEDLFQISVSNDEIMAVRTIGDLRAFVRSKLESGKA